MGSLSIVRTLGAARLPVLLAALAVLCAGAPPAAPAAARRALRAAENTTVLYNGALGGTPSTQGFIFQAFPPNGASQTFAGGVTTLTTTQSASAGYVSNLTASATPLDRTTGYTVTFNVQLTAESHSNGNRAGFSIITISEDRRGIELGFWPNEIWAQADGSIPPGSGMFTHAEGVTFDTTAALVPFQLAVKGDAYTLSAGGAPILTGSVRDYTTFVPGPGQIDPYETPNFLFLGDDTQSASATVRLSYVAVSAPAAPAPPEPVEEKLYVPLAMGE